MSWSTAPWGDRAADVGDATDDVLDGFDPSDDADPRSIRRDRLELAPRVRPSER